MMSRATALPYEIAASLSYAGVDMATWHSRFCHINTPVIIFVLNHNLCDGFKLCPTRRPHICDGCAGGKARKGALNPMRPRFTHEVVVPAKSAVRVFLDCCGPFRTKSIRGYIHFALFVDLFSKKMWVFPLKDLKSATLTLTLDLFLAKIRSDTGRTPLTLHCDNAPSFQGQFDPTPRRRVSWLRTLLPTTAK